MSAGFLISIVVFIWALNSGQFKDQQRARYLPLQGEDMRDNLRVSKISQIEAYALFGLACVGLLLVTTVLTFGILRG